MSLIQVRDLTFAYPGSFDSIFKNVFLQIDSNWKLGFIGRNGRGKTTFLNLLLGKYPYSGSISANVAFDYFPFPVPNKEQPPLQLAETLAPTAELWQIQRELNLLQTDPDILYRPFSSLSNGEQTKVLLTLLFLKENEFLLIDEPTNHLDAYSRKVVSAYLNSKKGFLLVSHDREFLDGCVDHILSINRFNMEVQRGNFSTWQENKRRQDQFELEENDRLKREIRQLSEAARRTASWSDKVEKTKKGPCSQNPSGLKPDKGFIGHKAAKMMKRSKTIRARQEKALEQKSNLLKNLETTEPLKLFPLEYHGSRLAEATGLSICYGESPVVEQIRFTVNKGDRIALCGRNGCGKSSVLKLLAGLDIPHMGQLSVNSGVIRSYVPQDSSFLQGSMARFIEQENLNESLFKTILRKLDFDRIQFEKDLSDLSAGQKKKVLLAKSLCQPAHLYLWDEPLNFIDVLSRIQIEELLLSVCPTIVFIEHDAAFQQSIATKRILLDQPYEPFHKRENK